MVSYVIRLRLKFDGQEEVLNQEVYLRGIHKSLDIILILDIDKLTLKGVKHDKHF